MTLSLQSARKILSSRARYCDDLWRNAANKPAQIFSILLAVLTLQACQTIKIEPIAGEQIGIVLMHGGFGGTQYWSKGLGSKLESAGILVVMPSMPWHRDRLLEKGYEEAMDEIEGYVERLRQAGAKRVLVGGHSIGANAALGYAARHEGLTGVILLAYGHVPGIGGYQRKIASSVDKAQSMIEAGNGEESAKFYDARRNPIKASANDLFSWFDQNGPATIHYNAPKIEPELPVLCIDGSYDKRQRCNRIKLIMPNKRTKTQLTVEASHLETPNKSFGEIIEWLRQL